ncbi:MAG: hypothetical protein ACPGWR_19070 [Ardenticatenaceae bacterium]
MRICDRSFLRQDKSRDDRSFLRQDKSRDDRSFLRQDKPVTTNPTQLAKKMIKP